MDLNLCVCLETYGVSEYRCSLLSHLNFSCSLTRTHLAVTKRPHTGVSTSHGSRGLCLRGKTLSDCFCGFKRTTVCPSSKHGGNIFVQSHSAPRCPSCLQGVGKAEAMMWRPCRVCPAWRSLQPQTVAPLLSMFISPTRKLPSHSSVAGTLLVRPLGCVTIYPKWPVKSQGPWGAWVA